MTALPNLTSPTDLSAFGKPHVVLVPSTVTFVAKLEGVYDIREPMGPQVRIGCGGAELQLLFNPWDEATCDRCFEWLKACIFENHKVRN
jgi:hypothetical protein